VYDLLKPVAGAQKRASKRSTPAKGSCRWIEGKIEFCRWHIRSNATASNDSDLRILVLFGKPGQGKTTMATHIVNYLNEKISVPEESATSYPSRDVVCSYFCGDEDEPSDRIVNIYKRLIIQIVNADSKFGKVFLQRFMANTDVAQEPEKLEDFLAEILKELASSRRRLYIVIDGLDECLAISLDRLLLFVEKASAECPDLRVFLTSRELTDIRIKISKKNSFFLNFESPKANDLLIPQHWVPKIFTESYFENCWLPPDEFQAPGSDIKVHEHTNKMQGYIIEQVSQKADHSPVWIMKVLEAMKAQHIRHEEEIAEFLANAPKELFDLYDNLFDSCIQGHESNGQRLWNALEILAIAMVPLRPYELYYAVEMWQNPEKFSNEKELAKEAVKDAALIWSSVRPFLRYDEAHISQNTGLSLHQSVKYWVERRHLEDSKSKLSTLTGEEVKLDSQNTQESPIIQPTNPQVNSPTSHVRLMNRKMALICLNYLSYPEFSVSELFKEIRYGIVSQEGNYTKSNPRYWKLYIYSAKYWFKHAKLLGNKENDTLLKETTVKFESNRFAYQNYAIFRKTQDIALFLPKMIKLLGFDPPISYDSSMGAI
jgi:hypothetical protein